MTDLAARIEAADRGSRELSDEVLRACGWEYAPNTNLADFPDLVGQWRRPRQGWHIAQGQQPSPTESVDDAIALLGLTRDRHIVLTVWVGFNDGLPHARCEFYTQYEMFKGTATSPALALSAALVRATRHG